MVAIAEKSKHTILPETETEKITWEVFQQEYLTREDEFKYEWLNGVVEKTPKTMNKNQTFIYINLLKFLLKLKERNTINGWFSPETDNFFAEHHRRPDIAFYTEEQIEQNKNNETEIPQFVIEIISDNDQINLIEKKMIDYQAANVPVVWHIFPLTQRIHVYNGKKMVICEKDDLCSAEPVIEGFKIKASDIFA